MTGRGGTIRLLVRTSSGVAMATMATAAIPAYALECPDNLGVYRGTTMTTHELRFTSVGAGNITVSKGKARAVYPFEITHSNGLSAPTSR